MSNEVNVEITEATLTNNVLKDVLICGIKSVNNVIYTSEALQKAIPLYESAAVYINHAVMANGDRNLEDRFGTAKNVRLTETGLVADIEVLVTHPMFAQIKEAYDNRIGKIGCSHNILASKVTTDDNGMSIVNEIEKVRSIDLVSNPATVKNLRESENVELVALTEQVKTLTTSNEELINKNKELVEKVNLMEQEIINIKDKAGKWQVPVAQPLTESKKVEKTAKELARWLCSND